MRGLDFAEINILLDQGHLQWGVLPISQSKTLKDQE